MFLVFFAYYIFIREIGLFKCKNSVYIQCNFKMHGNNDLSKVGVSATTSRHIVVLDLYTFYFF